MKRYHIIMEGQVQGVGMRYTCVHHANAFNLTGSVRNMSNGMVELYVQGEENAIQLFLDRIESSGPYIRIDELRIKETEVLPHENGFEIRY